jgi:CheY-like chemotaxis protein
MTSILFVDDEPLLLAALSRSLRKEKHRWHMVFATSGAAALEALAHESFDVIVSDLRMPEMDGAALLEQVRETHPTIARIMLSGNIEPTLAPGRALVDEMLQKPCSAADLRACIERHLDS